MIQRKIFNSFFTTKENGSGMGLSIAKEMVETQGGRITFHPRENEGSIFRITLPCYPPGKADPDGCHPD
ncbi:MAG: HAMP domain-containing sensor histidine kinase [Desulfobacterales bacterium]|nr:HAMP domain-containing sensor histidine kinase [Desulfobacterales bacterium]